MIEGIERVEEGKSVGRGWGVEMRVLVVWTIFEVIVKAF